MKQTNSANVDDHMGVATIDFIKDVKVGDVVWCLDGNASNFGKDGTWHGRGVWRLCPVISISRKYFTVKRGGGTQDFHLISGNARMVNGYTLPDHARGQLEWWYERNRRRVILGVEALPPADLKTVADLLDIIASTNKKAPE